MTSSMLLLKLKKKIFSRQADRDSEAPAKLSNNNDFLNADLFCHLTYMSALATSDLARNLLFEYAQSLPYTSSRFFRKVHFLAKKLNFDYAEACRMIGESTKEHEAKSILLRMSGALASGEKETEFLAREAQASGEIYGDGYERSVENMRKWTDAYVALILSAALVVVISVVSMLIFPMKTIFIVALTWFMLMATLLGAWILYRSSPKEVKTHSMATTSLGQKISKLLFKFVVIPAVIVMILIILITKIDLAWAMLVMSIILLPTGFIAVWDDRMIDKFDADAAGFLRNLGGVTKAIGTTVTEAIGRMDFGAQASLKKAAIGLNSTLQLGISPDVCWQRFIANTGSEHINRSVQIFWDGIAVGGDPQIVGVQASKFSMKVALLRAKRNMVASTFSYTCIVIHGALVVLLVGIYQVLVNFATLLKTANSADVEGSMDMLSQLPTFQFFTDSGSQLHTLNMMVIAMVIMLTIINAASIKVVEGGNNLKFLFYFGLTMAISGGSMLVVPDILKGIFSTVS